MTFQTHGLHGPAEGRLCAAPWGRLGAIWVASDPEKEVQTDV